MEDLLANVVTMEHWQNIKISAKVTPKHNMICFSIVFNLAIELHLGNCTLA
jgi:hypothetical protein